MIEIYVHPTCTSCRKAEALLADAGVQTARRDYFRDRFTEDELREVLRRAGVSPGDVLSTRAKVYRDRGLADQALSDDELLALMVEEPTLLRRPLAIGRGGTVVGFKADALKALAGAEGSEGGRWD